MNAVEILSISLIVVLLATLIAVTALFLRSQRDMLTNADRAHARWVEHQQSILDRFMAMDFQTFKSYEMSERSVSGGYEDPAPQDWVRIQAVPGLEEEA